MTTRVPSQAARDAAAGLYSNSAFWSKDDLARIRAGEGDDMKVVQAFAAFEATARKQALEEAAKVADDNRTDDDSMWDRAAVTIASEIRSIGSQNDG